MRNIILKEFYKNGYTKRKGHKTYDIAERKFLYLTPELVRGFLKLRKFDKYKKNVVDREVNLMKSKKEQLCQFVGEEPFNLIDVCCGDGMKVTKMFKEIPCGNGMIRYSPINVSKELVSLALANVKKSKIPAMGDYEPYVGDWDAKSVAQHATRLRSTKFPKNVILLLGSVLASFEINDYLFELSRGMQKGDYLIIGNGIRLGDRLAKLESYQNKVFDDWFIHLMDGLGFDENEVKYNARFGNSRVEMFYEVGIDKYLEYKSRKIKIRKGDEILVAILYKYYAKELEDFCKMYFSEVELLKDEENEYALVICKR